MRRLRTVAHLRTHAVHPADQLEVELGVAAEVVVDARAAFEQAGQDLVEVGDRVGVVEAVRRHRALGPGARAVPGFALGVAVAAEQQGLAVLPARHQHQHRLGLGETAQVPEVAVLAVGIVGVVAAHAFGRGRQDEDGVLVRHAHELLAATREFGGFDHGPAQLSLRRCRGPSTQSLCSNSAATRMNSATSSSASASASGSS